MINWPDLQFPPINLWNAPRQDTQGQTMEYIFPSDNDRATDAQLNEACEYIEYLLNQLQSTKEITRLQSENEALGAQSVQGMANKVCGDLPDGWVVNLCMENGAAWVEAIKPSGYTIEIDGADMSLVEQIDEALKQAFGTDREAGHE